MIRTTSFSHKLLTVSCSWKCDRWGTLCPYTCRVRAAAGCPKLLRWRADVLHSPGRAEAGAPRLGCCVHVARCHHFQRQKMCAQSTCPSTGGCVAPQPVDDPHPGHHLVQSLFFLRRQTFRVFFLFVGNFPLTFRFSWRATLCIVGLGLLRVRLLGLCCTVAFTFYDNARGHCEAARSFSKVVHSGMTCSVGTWKLCLRSPWTVLGYVGKRVVGLSGI